MARLIIENITLKQAKELAHWYEGQGEQDADNWFECQNKGRAPFTDMTHKGGWLQVSEDTVTIFCE